MPEKKISFQTDDGSIVDFYIEEQTRIAGVEYLLVSDSQEEEAEVYIMKDCSAADSDEASYEMVEDEEELNSVFKVFEELLQDEDTVLLEY